MFNSATLLTVSAFLFPAAFLFLVGWFWSGFMDTFPLIPRAASWVGLGFGIVALLLHFGNSSMIYLLLVWSAFLLMGMIYYYSEQ
jgi:hypothetical protein